ncbi:class C sortase [Corynebacterium hindlerae]|uniref:class C sortase n=1 Tax=Corynebacterium hindlerae TaxID=699041 RepID=UPI0031B69DBF
MSSNPTRGTVLINFALLLVAALGIGLLLYPQAAEWFASRNQAAEISGYTEGVRDTPQHELDEKLAAARAYNSTLSPGILEDPYLATDPDEIARTPIFQTYERLLRVTGTDAIGRVSYPRLDIDLPIYHGTSDPVLAKGVGHMFGTSVPVGGASTHSVLTAHSGLARAKLFTPLLKAEVGDVFAVDVLGQALYYRVDRTETVEADQQVDLRVYEGQDRLTLFTCTPIGVNSHRFMVYAQRITPEEADVGGALSGREGPGFPWWLVWGILGLIAVALLLFWPGRRRKKEPEQSVC